MFGREVAILGVDPDFDTFVHIVAAIGLRPVVACAGAGAFSTPGNSHVLDPSRLNDYARHLGTRPCIAGREIHLCGREEFTERLSRQDLPVLIGSYGARERNYFRETLLYARNSMGLTNRIVHPAALCDLVRLGERRYLAAGFPGSGNMLVQNLLAKVLERGGPPSVPNPVAGQLSHYALSYHFSIADKIASAFDEVGRFGDVQGPSHVAFGGTYISLKEAEAPTVIAGLPMRAYAWANPWTSSHEPLSRAALDFFSSQGLKVIQILRNPLDVMVSNAAKITSFAGQRCPQFLLNDRQWMTDMTEILASYAKAAIEFGTECFVIRYEDILDDPPDAVRRIAEYLGADIGFDDCREIWSSLEGKTLSEDVGHFWDPGHGKWRDFIPPEMAEIVCSPAIADLWRRIGYDISPAQFTGSKSAIPPESARLDYRQVVWQDSRWETSCGKRASLRSDGVCITRKNGLLGVTGSEFGPIMQELIDSPLLQDMLAAAYFHESFEPCPPVLSSYCDNLKESLPYHSGDARPV